jgi:hypothetical protein
MSDLPLIWTADQKTDQAKAQASTAIRSSTIALNRLKAILSQRLQSLEDAEVSLEMFSTDWSHRQAFIVGQKRELRETLKLLQWVK